MSYLKKSCFILSLAMLAGCATPTTEQTGSSLPQATGNQAGKVVVFGADSLGGETVGISFNEQFIAPIQAGKQFSQSVCSGAYHVEARSVEPQSRGKKVVRVSGEQFVQVAPQHTTYLEVSRAGQGWMLQEVTPEEWQMKSVAIAAGESGQETKIVRRMTAPMLQCH